MAVNFGWYLHFASILSVFGLFGALRVSRLPYPGQGPGVISANISVQEHALSIAIFANYLLLDTVLSSVPRFLVLSLLHQFSTSFCTSPGASASAAAVGIYAYSSHIESLASLAQDERDDAQCENVLRLMQASLGAGVLAAMVLQFVGALGVREYARRLVGKEVRAEMERERQVEAVTGEEEQKWRDEKMRYLG